MDNNGYYSFDQNALPHASMNQFEQYDTAATIQFQDGNSTAEQTSVDNETFTAEGMMNGGNFYSFNEGTLPQPSANIVWQQIPNTYPEILHNQYAFNQFALAQPAVTNAFDFNFNTNFGANTSIDTQAFKQTPTDLNNLDWSTATADPNALSGVTTGGLGLAVATGSDADAPLDIDESE